MTDMRVVTTGDTAPLTGSVNMDVTGASLEAHVRWSDGTTSTATPTVTAASTGAFSVVLPEDEMVVGIARMEMQVTFSNGQIQTVDPLPFLVREQYA